MRRAAPSAPISAKQLKHFAIAAVTITCLLALFASGEDWGAQAQVQAAQAKNDLARAQAKKLGTTKVSSAMKTKRAPQQMMANDPVPDIGPGSGGGGGSIRAAAPAQAAFDPRLPPRNLPNVPGATVTVTGQTIDQTPGAQKKRKKKAPTGPLTPQEREAAKAAAAARTGSVIQEGD